MSIPGWVAWTAVHLERLRGLHLHQVARVRRPQRPLLRQRVPRRHHRPCRTRDRPATDGAEAISRRRRSPGLGGGTVPAGSPRSAPPGPGPRGDQRRRWPPVSARPNCRLNVITVRSGLPVARSSTYDWRQPPRVQAETEHAQLRWRRAEPRAPGLQQRATPAERGGPARPGSRRGPTARTRQPAPTARPRSEQAREGENDGAGQDDRGDESPRRTLTGFIDRPAPGGTAQPLRLVISSVAAGRTVCRSPTTPKSTSSKIGASSSLFTATIVFEVCMPARCWIAPEMPLAT